MSERWRPEGYEDQDIASCCSVSLFWLIVGTVAVVYIAAKVMAI